MQSFLREPSEYKSALKEMSISLIHCLTHSFLRQRNLKIFDPPSMHCPGALPSFILLLEFFKPLWNINELTNVFKEIKNCHQRNINIFDPPPMHILPLPQPSNLRNVKNIERVKNGPDFANSLLVIVKKLVCKKKTSWAHLAFYKKRIRALNAQGIPFIPA